MRAMGRHGFPGIPRIAMVLREASALMLISSIIIIAPRQYGILKFRGP